MGCGTYGTVVEAFDQYHGRKVAIKKVHNFAEDEVSAKIALREVRCLKALKCHPNVSGKVMGVVYAH